ncbi:MAG: hypothetical protein HKP27_05560, partial [Myxococcales bacterium]|nr:hypothetical protein [Myxococcales bacterium]
VMTSRRFEEDIRRHFVGEVLSAAGPFVEIEGYTFVFNSSLNEYKKLPELRTRMMSFADSGQVVNKLPREVDVSRLAYKMIDQRLVITDSSGYSLAINEFGVRN